LELLTVTLVSTAFYSDPRSWVWRTVAFAASFVGLAASGMHAVEYRRRIRAGYLPTPADKFQNGASWLPFLSYTILSIAAFFSYSCPIWAPFPDLVFTGWGHGGCAAFPLIPALGAWDGWLRGVLVWLLISGLVEVYVTLSPHLLEAEPYCTPLAHRIEVPSSPPNPVAKPVLCAELIPSTTGSRRIPVVLLPEMWGLTPDMLDIAGRLAQRGHPVYAVDYYTGRAGWFPKLRTFIRAESRACRYAVEARAVREWVNSRRPEAVAVVGFSIGATAALELRDGWAGIAAFYPTRPSSFEEEEPPWPPLFVAYGLGDRQDVTSAGAAFEAKGRPGTTHQYGAARHGFMGSGRSAWLFVRAIPPLFRFGPDPKQAALAWKDLCHFLDELAPTSSDVALVEGDEEPQSARQQGSQRLTQGTRMDIGTTAVG